MSGLLRSRKKMHVMREFRRFRKKMMAYIHREEKDEMTDEITNDISN